MNGVILIFLTLMASANYFTVDADTLGQRGFYEGDPSIFSIAGGQNLSPDGDPLLHRPARYDPAWRHIGLGKRFDQTVEAVRTLRSDSLNSFGQNGQHWKLIGLGRRR